VLKVDCKSIAPVVSWFAFPMPAKRTSAAKSRVARIGLLNGEEVEESTPSGLFEVLLAAVDGEDSCSRSLVMDLRAVERL
jgi:hypothetical protein